MCNPLEHSSVAQSLSVCLFQPDRGAMRATPAGIFQGSRMSVPTQMARACKALRPAYSSFQRCIALAQRNLSCRTSPLRVWRCRHPRPCRNHTIHFCLVLYETTVFLSCRLPKPVQQSRKRVGNHAFWGFRRPSGAIAVWLRGLVKWKGRLEHRIISVRAILYWLTRVLSDCNNILKSRFFFLGCTLTFISTHCRIKWIAYSKADGLRIAVIPFVEHHLPSVGSHRVSCRFEDVGSIYLEIPDFMGLCQSDVYLPWRFHRHNVHVAVSAAKHIAGCCESITESDAVIEVYEQ